MQKPINETVEFGQRVGLNDYRAGYLHDAVRFYVAAVTAIKLEGKYCNDIGVADTVALHLMRAAMAAKYQPEFPRLYGLQEAVENMASTLESGFDDLAEAIREFSEARAADTSELAEAVRRIGDECKDVAVGIDTHRRMLDNHLDVMQHRMDAKAANDSRGQSAKRKAA